jgi:Xaa-Pro dipeptidase
MTLKRRDFINLSAIAAATGIAGISSCTSNVPSKEKRSTMDDLQSMINDVVPITLQEREGRVEKAQRLLTEQKIEALILDAGTSMEYFTGISWWPSERPMVAIIPAKGTVSYVCPGFEESRLRELIKIGKDVYAWQEDESNYNKIAVALKNTIILSGSIGM